MTGWFAVLAATVLGLSGLLIDLTTAMDPWLSHLFGPGGVAAVWTITGLSLRKAPAAIATDGAWALYWVVVSLFSARTLFLSAVRMRRTWAVDEVEVHKPLFSSMTFVRFSILGLFTHIALLVTTAIMIFAGKAYKLP